VAESGAYVVDSVVLADTVVRSGAGIAVTGRDVGVPAGTESTEEEQ
jgi:hypothetical protein